MVNVVGVFAPLIIPYGKTVYMGLAQYRRIYRTLKALRLFARPQAGIGQSL
jgi:hypothetical protein